MINDQVYEPEKQKLPKYARDLVGEVKKQGCDSVTHSQDSDGLPVITIISGSNVVKVCFFRSYGWQNLGCYQIKVSSSKTTRSFSFPLRIDGTYNYELIAQRVIQLIKE